MSGRARSRATGSTVPSCGPAGLHPRRRKAWHGGRCSDGGSLNPTPLLSLGLAALLVAGCTSLRNQWLVGIEPVRRTDPGQPDPTPRLLADLAALPNLMVVDLGAPRNAHDFASLAANKIRLFSGLETGAFCLRSSYGVFSAGQLRYASGLVIAATEVTDAPSCIDLFATRLYRDLVRQGL